MLTRTKPLKKRAFLHYLQLRFKSSLEMRSDSGGGLETQEAGRKKGAQATVTDDFRNSDLLRKT